MPRPPLAKRVPVERDLHGEVVVDDYAWLRGRDDPEVIAYLEAENAHTEAFLERLRDLREQLFQEIKGHVQETDESAPVPKDGWEYYLRTIEGQEYVVHCRRPRGGGEEQVLLDENRLAADESLAYLSVGSTTPSPDHRLLAYAVDTTGDIEFEVRVRDLDTGEDLPDRLTGMFGGVEWAADGESLLYVVIDDAHRSYRLRRHRLGDPQGADPVLYEEEDERFWLWLTKSRDGRRLVLDSSSKTTSEVRIYDAADPGRDPVVVAERRQDCEYHVEPHGERLFVVTNDEGAENFRLVETTLADPRPETWREVLPHRERIKIEDVDAFAGHLAVTELGDALQRIRTVPLDGGEPAVLEQPEDVYAVWMGANLEFDTSVVRYEYQSMVTPPSDVDHDLDAGTRTVVKQQPVPGYDPARYETSRLWATAPDGERVPISVVHRRGLPRDGSAPAVLYGYGSYETFYEPGFSVVALPLLERGWVVAIAHIRGGGEMGRPWYESGKMLSKGNTFTDFVACAEHLVAEGCTSPDRLCARGGSAGGLLVGAAMNLRPDLFRAVIARVPFVDVINTMLDESLPLTVTEWEEWGDPHDPEVYRYMRTYAPYENVQPASYPALFVTAGLNDSQVQYWEPAKWVARLRATATGDRPILLKTEMGAGHRGKSGRYETWREEALFLAFLLDAVGVAGQVDH